jgi:hypothetical protein
MPLAIKSVEQFGKQDAYRLGIQTRCTDPGCAEGGGAGSARLVHGPARDVRPTLLVRFSNRNPPPGSSERLPAAECAVFDEPHHMVHSYPVHAALAFLPGPPIVFGLVIADCGEKANDEAGRIAVTRPIQFRNTNRR